MLTVHLGYAAGDFHTLLDGDLYLPEGTWHEDRTRGLILSMVSFLFLMEETQQLREKNPRWSIRQVRAATDAKLGVGMAPSERGRKLRLVAGKIEYWQHTAAKAERAHRKRSLRELRRIGVCISKLKKCHNVF